MKNVQIILFFLLSFGMATPAWSIMIGGEEVGSIDVIKGVTDTLGACGPGSNPGNEECWGESVLGGTDLTYSAKTDPVSVMYDAAYETAAFALVSNPGYYIVKNAQTWILLENRVEKDWGVLDLTDPALDGFKLNLGKEDQLFISHVTEFNGTTVPEPGSLALITIGLFGIGAARKLKKH